MQQCVYIFRFVFGEKLGHALACHIFAAVSWHSIQNHGQCCESGLSSVMWEVCFRLYTSIFFIYRTVYTLHICKARFFKEPRNRFQGSIPRNLEGRFDKPICQTGPPGYIGWRNRFLEIDSWAPQTFTNSSSAYFVWEGFFAPVFRTPLRCEEVM